MDESTFRILARYLGKTSVPFLIFIFTRGFTTRKNSVEDAIFTRTRTWMFGTTNEISQFKVMEVLNDFSDIKMMFFNKSYNFRLINKQHGPMKLFLPRCSYSTHFCPKKAKIAHWDVRITIYLHAILKSIPRKLYTLCTSLAPSGLKLQISLFQTCLIFWKCALFYIPLLSHQLKLLIVCNT